MPSRLALVAALLPLFTLLPVPAAAQQAPEAPAAEPASPQRGGEPEVRHIVVEDDNARIEELRVRGLTKNITVHPKNGAKPYEIEPLDPTRPPPNSADGARTAGKRVWNVLAF